MLDCIVESNGSLEDYSKYIWKALESTAFQILEDSSTGEEDAIATPITKCISETAQLQLQNKLQAVSRDILSMNSECCVTAIDSLRSWLDLKNAEFLDADVNLKSWEQSAVPEPFEIKSPSIQNSISKYPTPKNPVFGVKFLVKSRSGTAELNFRSIRVFKETCIFKLIQNTQNLRITLRWTYVFTTHMNYDIYINILNSMEAAVLVQDWGAVLKFILDYEYILRDALKFSGHLSSIKLYSIGKKTTGLTKSAEVPKVFKLREPILLKVPEILTIDQMLQVATEISFDEAMFTNTFVTLVNDRVKSIMKKLENDRRLANVELYNTTQYKHNIVSTCKRRYTRKLISMNLAGIRYKYVLEHHLAFQQIAGKTNYIPKVSQQQTLLIKIDTYKILKTTRDKYTLQNIESAEIRHSYLTFYNKVLCNHADQVKNFYNQETWTITLATEQLLLVLDAYLGITRILYKIQKGSAKGQFIGTSPKESGIIHISSNRNLKYRHSTIL